MLMTLLSAAALAQAAPSSNPTGQEWLARADTLYDTMVDRDMMPRLDMTPQRRAEMDGILDLCRRMMLSPPQRRALAVEEYRRLSPPAREATKIACYSFARSMIEGTLARR